MAPKFDPSEFTTVSAVSCVLDAYKCCFCRSRDGSEDLDRDMYDVKHIVVTLCCAKDLPVISVDTRFDERISSVAKYYACFLNAFLQNLLLLAQRPLQYKYHIRPTARNNSRKTQWIFVRSEISEFY